MEKTIERLKTLQEAIFAPTLDRVALLSWHDFSQDRQVIRIHVVRNHAFEQIEKVMAPFLELSEVDSQFSYSGYDDTLSSVHAVPDCDLVLVWLDLARYAEPISGDYIQNQLTILEKSTSAPVVFLPLGGQLKDAPKGIHVYSLLHLELKMGDQFWDSRGEVISGTRLSLKGATAVARDLGLRVIPALNSPPIKAIVVDLDNTLYDGVLGEDGTEGVILSDFHSDLQSSLKSLSQNGVLLSMVTKNDRSDVEDLFRARTDFPLQLDDFFLVKASWEKKSKSVREVHEATNTHPESTIFLDDNLFEHIEVNSKNPRIRHLIAPTHEPRTAEILQWHPGVFSFSPRSNEDLLRVDDLRANEKRQTFRSSDGASSLYEELEVQLEFRVNVPQDLDRVVSLLNKTNQFVFSYLRPNESVLRIKQDSKHNQTVVAVGLSDKLSESGIVGVLVLSESCQGWDVDEVAISCRALGRELEEPIVIGALKEFLARQGEGRALNSVAFANGPRNTPAQLFFAEWFQEFDPMKVLGYRMPMGISFTMISSLEKGCS